MVNGIHHKHLYLLGIPFAGAPYFAACYWAFRHGFDLTLLWVAFAAFAGATLPMLLGRARKQSPRVIIVLSIVAFACSVLCALLAGRMLGVSSPPGATAVALAFGFSSAMSYALDTLSRVAAG